MHLLKVGVAMKGLHLLTARRSWRQLAL